MAHRVPFYLYRRHKKNGDYWYVCFLDPETGKQTTAKSIDCLKEKLGILDFRSVTRKVEAAVIAQKALDAGIIFNDLSNESFQKYCLDFWDYEKSSYIALRNRLKPNSIGREYAYNMQKSFQKDILPLLPSNLKLGNVTPKVVNKVVDELYRKELSNGTIQILISSMSQPLKEAVRLGVLRSNPMKGVLKGVRNEKNRGVLTLAEMEALISKLEEKKEQLSSSYYYGIVLALSTGMRSGEIRALQVDDFASAPYPGWEKLLIRHSIGHLTGLKETKGKYERAVLIPSDLARNLKQNAGPSGIVLPSTQGSKRYISSPTLRNVLYELLEEIGIDDKERERRNLTFHSLRHTFSTLCRDEAIAQEDRMLVLGHKSKGVNERYTHETDAALYRVSAFTKKVLENIGGKEKQSNDAKS